MIDIRSSLLARGSAALAAAVLGLALAGCADTDNTPTTPADPAATAAGEASEAAETAAADDPRDDGRDIVAEPPAKSWEEALAAATEAFPNSQPIMIQLERKDDGKLQYEIDLVSETEKYEVDMDADTLDKTEEDKEGLGADADSERNRRFNPDELQTNLERAVEVARGEQAGSINKWKIEGNNDENKPKVHYEFEMDRDNAPGDETIKVDAATGELIQD